MAEQPSREAAYEKLLKAMSEGEFGMAKYIWEYISKIEDISDEYKERLEGFKTRIDKFIEEYRVKDGKDGKDGAPGPVGPEGPEGKQGPIGPVGPAGRDGMDGVNGFDGKDGATGRAPKHEWDGSKIRFENPDGSWGAWVDLLGPIGPAGMSFGPDSAGGMGGLTRIRGANFEMHGVNQIYLGNNLIATKLGDGSVRIDAQGGSGGSSLITEELTPTQAGNNITLDLTDLSQVYDTVQFVTRNGQILAASSWSQTGDTITVFNAAADEIFSVQATY